MPRLNTGQEGASKQEPSREHKKDLIMNVKELKEYLSKLPEHLPVFLSDETNLTISTSAAVETRTVDGEAWCVISDLYPSNLP